MQSPAERIDYLVAGAVWVSLGTVFWIMQDTSSWNVLFPMAGFAWMAVPLIVTRFRVGPLLAVSALLLTVGLVLFLVLVWGATVVLAFIGSLFFGDFESGGIPVHLAAEGLKVVPGAAAGAAAGIILRRSLLPVE